jgi:hypothetical protein
MSALKNSSFLLGAFLLALPSQLIGDIAQVTASATDTEPAGSTIVFSGQLSIPKFDPSLGTLDSIDVNLQSSGSLRWAVTQTYPIKFYTDYNLLTTVSFLGADAIWRSQLDLPPFAPCGYPGPTVPCDPVHTNIGYYGPSTIVAQIKDGSFRGGGYPGGGAFSPVPTDLATFVGNGLLDLPVTVSVVTSTDNVIGELAGPQELDWSLSWDYNYTPAGPVVTPEPRWLAILLLGLLPGFRMLRR